MSGEEVVVVLAFSGVALSHTGLVRANNEDAGLLAPACMVVADGVGGAAAGEVAAATAAYVIGARVLAEPHADPLTTLEEGVRQAQGQVADGVRRDAARTGMATTLTALATDGDRVALAHIGDSRAYLFRQGALSRLTRDHTLVQQLVEDGTLDEAHVRTHPWRNIVLRSINGGTEDADLRLLDLVPGDRVLLASDGLTDLVSELRIAALLSSRHDDAAADALIDAALAAGGRDNVTCLLATVVDRPRIGSDGVLVGAVRNPRNVVDTGVVRMSHSA